MDSKLLYKSYRQAICGRHVNRMSRSKASDDNLTIKTRYVFWSIILAALFFRLFHTGNVSLWTDELATYWVSTAPTIGECIVRASMTQGQSPFYYILERFFLLILPHNEFSLRLLSLMASMLSIFFIYHLAKSIFGDTKTAHLSGLIFALHEIQIYYAQEARPYALGIMFVLLSQIYFMNLLKNDKTKDLVLYILFSIFVCYSHYLLAPLLIVQNIYYAYKYFNRNRSSGKSVSPAKWFISQALIGISILFLLFQLCGIFKNRPNWDWLKQLNFPEALELLGSMFDPFVIIILLVCFLIFWTSERIDILNALKRNKDQLFLLLSWLIVPFLFVYFASHILGVSFFDKRYLILSLIPFYLLLANFLCVFKSDILRITFPGTFLVIYLGLVLIPNYVMCGNFSWRIQHNWGDAITFIRKNFKSGDAILLRSGFVNENWIPPDNPVIDRYIKCPFYSFYWTRENVNLDVPIYNLTYTYGKKFDQYYEELFNKLEDYRRIWVIGVNTPNTNYLITSVSFLLEKKYGMRVLYEADFSGVYLCLISPNPFFDGLP